MNFLLFLSININSSVEVDYLKWHPPCFWHVRKHSASLISLFQVQIKVESRMPFVELNLQLKTKIRNVMETNYDRLNRILNLSRFHANEGK